MFKHSMKLLFNTKNDNLVLDNELISSYAQDVESKVLSHRKTGKESPDTDCFADLILCILYGMKLRFAGESQKSNVIELAKTVP